MAKKPPSVPCSFAVETNNSVDYLCPPCNAKFLQATPAPAKKSGRGAAKWRFVDCTPKDPSQLLTKEKLVHFFRRRPRSKPRPPVYIPHLFPDPYRPPIKSAVWVKFLGLRRPVN